MTKPIEYMTGEVLTTKNAEGDFNVNITGRVLEENRSFTVGKNELLPVPQSALDANENLTQNPGY
jgi:hypothetical protein